MAHSDTRYEFTKKEYEEIRELTRQKMAAPSNKQKVIRAKIRRLGFYWNDYNSSKTPFNLKTLEQLFDNGTLRLVDKNKSHSSHKKDTYKIQPQNINAQRNEPSILQDSLSFKEQFNINDIELSLINGNFLPVNELQQGNKIPDKPGLYCIKIRKGINFSQNYGKISENGIIYIGKAEKSLKKRLWNQELNHDGHATFFRSIGAMLGKRPPKGSLYGSNSRNYEFNCSDTEFIREWMRQSLYVNFVEVSKDFIISMEDRLIKKYCPLVNIKGNPQKSKAIEAVRKECVEIAHSKN